MTRSSHDLRIILRIIATLGLAAAAFVPAGLASATPVRVHHVPPAEAAPNAPLLLEAHVERGWESTLEARFRGVGAATWQAVEFEKGEGTYLATVPADIVQPPGIEYFILGTNATGATSAHFASAADPHRVMVYEEPTVVLRQRELDRVSGRRARVRFATELVDYGTRTIGGADVADSYYRVDVDFTYRLLRFPLYSLRFGYTRLRGHTPATERGESPCDPCEVKAGFSAGGWFELRFRVGKKVDVDARGMVQATPSGFNVGGRGELRLGEENGSHVALGSEAILDVGTAAFFRLGWDTVPSLPMAATIELTDFPATHRATGVRLIYDVTHPFPNGLRLGARVGYQARDQGIGGATGGLNLAFEF
jgi:hypothetical protein